MGWVLSGFFLGYSLLMVPVGAVADRYSPKWVLGISVAWWSLLTALTPLPHSLIGMAIVRVLVGIGQSGVIPCINSILVRWFPRDEYSRAAVFSWSGGSAGAILAFPLASAILNFWGWQAVFFSFACLGALWLPFWIMGVTDNPAASNGVSETELAHILDGRPELQKVAAFRGKRFWLCRQSTPSRRFTSRSIGSPTSSYPGSRPTFWQNVTFRYRTWPSAPHYRSFQSSSAEISLER